MAMQPFKMLVGDNVNEEQKGLAYSIQSFLCNAGSLAGYVFPFLFAAIGISNVAPAGVIPDSVIYSFYVGAAILILRVIYTTFKVREYPPQEYELYHPTSRDGEEKKESGNMFVLLKNAPSQFWTVGLVQFFCWAAFMYMWTYTNGTVAHQAQFFCWAAFMYMWTYTNGTVAHQAFDAPTLEKVVDGVTAVVLNTESQQYQDAGDWVGILFAVQAVGSVIWAVVIPFFKNRKFIYALSLVLGGVGFISINFMHDKYLLFISYLLIGCAWAAMLALPFTILTNALKGGHIGTYLGLFNGTICIPQIVAASLGGTILSLFTTQGQLPPEVNMLVLAGVLLFCGAAAVFVIKEK